MERPTLAERVSREMDCKCVHVKLAKRTIAGGTVQFVWQCQQCGRPSPAVSSKKLTTLQICTAEVFDPDLREQWDEKCRVVRQRAAQESREERREEWFARYQDYLKSPEWAEQRENRLALDRWKCRAGLKGCLREATIVHHKSYDLFRSLGEAPMWDLVSVCRRCHARLHPHLLGEKGPQ